MTNQPEEEVDPILLPASWRPEDDTEEGGHEYGELLEGEERPEEEDE